MCGIIGYRGTRNGKEVVLEGLKSLEYRGYDSWGIAVFNDKVEVRKEVGKIGGITLNQLNLKGGHTALGHTRWSTHGAVTKKNAHPHLSQNRKLVVVHNGIVENFQELRSFLENQGFRFVSDTDTEILPHYIQYYMDQGYKFRDAVRKTLANTRGSFAIVVVNQDTKEMIGARRGSPLVVGLGKNEFFLASDVPAFLEYTKKVVYLDDNELVTVNQRPTFFDLTNNQVIEKEVSTITWSKEQARKGKYPHFMLKEIDEQKFTIKKASEQPSEKVKKATNMLQQAKGVFFVGCGTSYHACVSAAYVFAHVAKVHVNVVLASEFNNYEEFLTDQTLVVALSQSGETADVLDAVKTAQKHHCRTISVVNVMGSTLTRMCQLNLMMNAGPEICVLSTKSYTSQLTILLLLAYSVAGKLEEGKQLIQKVTGSISQVIDNNLKKLKSLAGKIKHNHDFFLIGRDLAFPSALEGALKVKEVSYIHAEGFAGAELKHGTIALIEKGTPALVLSTDRTRSQVLSNAMEIKTRGGFIIGLDSKNNQLFDYFIQVPEMGNANPILMIIPIQIFAYYLGLARGCDVDKPRNLAKSVVVR